MNSFFKTMGIGLLVGFIPPFLLIVVGLLIIVVLNGTLIESISFITFFGSVYGIIGSIFGIIGALAGNYSKKTFRAAWIGGAIGAGLWIGLLVLLFFLSPCVMLGGC